MNPTEVQSLLLKLASCKTCGHNPCECGGDVCEHCGEAECKCEGDSETSESCKECGKKECVCGLFEGKDEKEAAFLQEAYNYGFKVAEYDFYEKLAQQPVNVSTHAGESFEDYAKKLEQAQQQPQPVEEPNIFQRGIGAIRKAFGGGGAGAGTGGTPVAPAAPVTPPGEAPVSGFPGGTLWQKRYKHNTGLDVGE